MLSFSKGRKIVRSIVRSSGVDTTVGKPVEKLEKSSIIGADITSGKNSKLQCLGSCKVMLANHDGLVKLLVGSAGSCGKLHRIGW